MPMNPHHQRCGLNFIRHELDVGLADVREELDKDGALLYNKIVIL